MPARPEADTAPDGFTFPYAEAIAWRFVSGAPKVPGPATVWARMRLPLVAGEPTSPLQQAVVLTDSGSGVSAALDWECWSFVNVELTVHLARAPAAGLGLPAGRDHDARRRHRVGQHPALRRGRLVRRDEPVAARRAPSRSLIRLTIAGTVSGTAAGAGAPCRARPCAPTGRA